MFTLCYFLAETLSESGILHGSTWIRDNTKIWFVDMIYEGISVEQKLPQYVFQLHSDYYNSENQT